jgi:type I restriction enzyme R subunit
MVFQRESEFEDALIEVLKNYGWENEVLKNPSESELIKNWASILFDNNRDIDRLNNYPLTDSEMAQILEQITALRTPLKLNGFINGKTISIKRDNPNDTLHLGKEVSLKIYDRGEIAAGQSRYQIAQQPKFPTKSRILNDRRGDLMLLINGMPVIHIELKKSGIPVSQAYNQIEKYANEGIFTGLFSLVQVFVAMEPEETVYFANPGPDGKFNTDYYFHWANFDNTPMNDWKYIAADLLSIPMAHKLIGFYTVADTSDGVLKVMRSYQYYAANAISDVVSKTDWKSVNQLGGHVWHTTGSGKTMTSFKSAQLISNSKDADKVVFLIDRIELGTQSLKEYKSFADENEEVQATEDTSVLIGKLKSSKPSDILIVTSIQKMSNIKEEAGLNAHDLALIQSKRIVVIIDECHRSTFGDMLIDIKAFFKNAIFFGFTGTPINTENQKKMNTTSTVLGNELHRYSIADGIRDKNVLGFDPYKVMTFKDRDIRKAVALEKAKAKTEAEVLADPKKTAVYNEYMNPAKIKMSGYKDANDNYIKGIEDYVPKSQYETAVHQNKVVEDIISNWVTLSRNSKFHAIFATSSIPEAITYYRLIKGKKPDLKVACLFDPTIDNNGGVTFKELGLVEIVEDYNKQYNQSYKLATYGKYKKDIAARLAHKEPYTRIERTPEEQIDLLIVVDQMLTGFDSKWINTLYMDKVLYYENIIQAFSRTNRLFGADKPFGTIRYYRYPHSMERNINYAVKEYSGDKPLGLFVERIDFNLQKVNACFADIKDLFTLAGVIDFEKLPESAPERGRFAKLFKELNLYLEAAKIQGFTWEKHPMDFNENTYLILALRYKELFTSTSIGGGMSDAPYDLVGYLTEIDTGLIDADYMNSRFDKYLKLIHQSDISSDAVSESLRELHKTFATLTQEEQKYAEFFLRDVQRGDARIEDGKSLRDYITDYRFRAKANQIHNLAVALGLDEVKLKSFMALKVTETNINEFGRFEELKSTVNKEIAKTYFEAVEKTSIPIFKVNIKVDKLLREFIISGGFEIIST